ncbi:bifunctional helix-turn-helix transcriptional regulator/GNAT family N-acetyltransferase [Pseudomonas koreensis]
MPASDLVLVDSIREASRRIVRLLGFMQSTLASTQYPPSAVHSILEIGKHGDLTAAQLSEILGLEKSSVSRMVRKLVDAGELEETSSHDDGRIKLLSLTKQGRSTLEAITRFGRKQVVTALEHLLDKERDAVNEGLTTYARALEANLAGQPTTLVDSVEIRSGYIPGVVGRVAEMHATFYARHSGFGQFFESQVATGVAEFVSRLTSPRNGLWAAVHQGTIVGSVAIDGEDLGGNIAHLRWFIVADGLRGAGVGKILLREAVAFCEQQNFEVIRLWTFKGLDAARRLYEEAGFFLAEEYLGEQWGSPIVEQRFERVIPKS